MDRCDALVVGGGPAGSACAGVLCGAGLDVVVFDRARFPRDKVCAGWTTPAVWEALRLDPRTYAESAVLEPIFGFRVGLMGEPSARVGYPRPVSYAVRRCEFDAFLLKRSGARVREGERVEALRRTRSGWVVNESIQTPVLIGAGGYDCPIARYLNPGAPPGQQLVVAREVEFAPENGGSELSVESAIPELFFERDLRGYGWVVRKGPFVNVGLGRLERRALKPHLEGFVAALRERGKLPAGPLPKLRGHVYLLCGNHARRIVTDRALLVGDAAGLAAPRTGEGIRPAVESGLLAAWTLLASAGRYGRDDLEAYARAVDARFGVSRRRRWGSPTTGPTHTLRRWLAARALATPAFARHIVLDRWFLQRGEDPLRAPSSLPSLRGC